MPTFFAIVLISFFVLGIISILLYIPRIKYFRYAFKPVPKLKNDKTLHFGIIIPARNEFGTIQGLMKSLEQQTYNKSNFDLYIIVADKNDPTVEYIHANYPDCQVLIDPDQKSKANALDFAFQHILKSNKKYDAYIIIDADDILDKDFLLEMNNACASNADIIAPRKRIKNIFDKNPKSRTLFSNCSGLINALNDDLGNRYRDQHGIVDNICGQGMLVSDRIIKKFGGWKFETLAEDFELKAIAILEGYTTLYYPYAILYGEEPTSLGQTINRRTRWLTGAMQCFFKYTKRIKKIIHPKGKPVNKSAFEYSYIIIPVVLITVFAVLGTLCGIIGAIVYGAMHNPMWYWGLIVAGIILFTVYIDLVLFTLMALKASHDSYQYLTKRQYLGVLLYHPIYLAGYMVAFANGFFLRNQQKWKPVKRINYQQNEDLYDNSKDTNNK